MKKNKREASFDAMFRGIVMRDERGFTLIELLVVLAIISILVSIAIPAFLGQREKAKARSLVSGAKSAVSEIQGWMDAFVAGEPYLALNATGNMECHQSAIAPPSRTCAALYPGTPIGLTYSDLNHIIDDALIHHRAKNERSPYDPTLDLFTNSPDKGVIVLTVTGTKTINISAYALDTTTPVFNTSVTVR